MRAMSLTVVVLTAASCRSGDGPSTVRSEELLGEGIAAAAPAARAAPGAGQDQGEPPEELLDPRAVEALIKMDRSLDALDRFALEAHTSREIVVQTDFKLQHNADVRILVDRSDRRLVARLAGEEGKFLLLVDANQLTILDPEKKLYAQMPAEETLGKTLHAAAEKHGLETPLVDFLTPQNRLEDAIAYGYLDQGEIHGRETEHIAVRREDVDWQVWIDEETGLPLKYVITTRDDWTDPEFIAELTWDVSPSCDAAQFNLDLPEGAVKIPFSEDVATPDQDPGQDPGQGQGQGQDQGQSQSEGGL
jgi:hypothetical protein